MFGLPGVQEFLIVILVIGILSMTGLWPSIIQGLRELRGDASPGEGSVHGTPTDLDLCYRMLGVSSTAPWEEIEQAYRRKAKIHHPDHGGDDDTMRALNEAYTMIKKARKHR